jgi:hypothetical protein
MRRAIVVLFCLALSACSTATQPPAPKKDPEILSSTTTKVGSMVITDQMIGRSRGTMPLSRVATSGSYGYSAMAPVKVGGGFDKGADRTYQFLNSLRGPNGEDISYDRVGTCCTFDTPNSPFEGKGLLEVYVISYPGLDQPKRLYFNWYDAGEVLIPIGLTATK